MTDSTNLHQAYRAAHERAVLLDRSHEGRLRAAGRDRLSLLHRMSTNDVEHLPAGEARPTVLTTALARTVDALWVLNRGDTVLLLTSPGRAQAVRRWLSGYVFFNDDVRFDDVSDSLAQFCVVGPQAARVAEGAFPGVTAPQENRFLTAQAPGEGAGGEWILLRGRGLAGDGVTLVGPREEAAGVWERLGGAGALPAGEETFQVLRVEAGQGYAGHEISEEYIPLEAGLWPAVSFHKGCYIGQEIIARMESRGKLAKTLVGLKLAAPVAVGDEVRQGERRVGEVSSAVVSPGAGPIALAFVKPDVAEPGTRLTAGDVAAQVVAFPIR